MEKFPYSHYAPFFSDLHMYQLLVKLFVEHLRNGPHAEAFIPVCQVVTGILIFPMALNTLNL